MVLTTDGHGWTRMQGQLISRNLKAVLRELREFTRSKTEGRARHSVRAVGGKASARGHEAIQPRMTRMNAEILRTASGLPLAALRETGGWLRRERTHRAQNGFTRIALMYANGSGQGGASSPLRGVVGLTQGVAFG